MTTHHTTITESVDIDAAIAAAKSYFLSTDKMHMIGRYSWDRGIDEDAIDLKDEETREDYEDFVEEYASERVHEALAELCWCIDAEEGRASAWRSLTVAEDFLEKGICERPIGRFWAYSEDAAEPHWGNFGDDRREIVLHGVVDIHDIDWQTSVTVNAHSEEEKELRLKDSAVVHVVSATWTAIHGKEPSRTIPLGLDLPAGDSACLPAGPRVCAAA